MVFLVSQLSSFTTQENKELEVLLCWIIHSRDFESLKKLLNSGLSSNYKLNNEVRIGNFIRFNLKDYLLIKLKEKLKRNL